MAFSPDVGDPIQDGDIVVRRLATSPDEWACAQAGSSWTGCGLLGLGYGARPQRDAFDQFLAGVAKRNEAQRELDQKQAAVRAQEAEAKTDVDLRVIVLKTQIAKIRRDYWWRLASALAGSVAVNAGINVLLSHHWG